MKIGDKVKRKAQYADTFSHSVNAEYIVTDLRNGNVTLEDLNGENRGTWDEYRFDVVVTDYLTQFKEAQSLIGKNVQTKGGGTTFKVDSVALYTKGQYSSPTVNSYFENHEFCVAVKGSGRSLPFENVQVVEDYKELKISNDYTAKVYKDKVEVGCQTIPLSTVEEIIKLAQSL